MYGFKDVTESKKVFLGILKKLKDLGKINFSDFTTGKKIFDLPLDDLIDHEEKELKAVIEDLTTDFLLFISNTYGMEASQRRQFEKALDFLNKITSLK